MEHSLTRCWAEIDLSALRANVTILQKFRPEIMAVVKADAYGHDARFIVPELQRLNVKHFAVATVDEAAEIRSLPGMEENTIYLMAAVLGLDSERIVDLDLIPFATDTAFVTQLSEIAVRRGTIAQVHIEVDTGIGRAGISTRDLERTLVEWNALPGIDVTGICTHFTAADGADAQDSTDQLALFETALKSLPPQLTEGLAVHAANSPATLRLPTGCSTFFRPGLLLYGIPPSQQLSRDFPFTPVLSLKARVLLARQLPKGSDISYSRTYRLQHDAKIATIGTGYGDGFPRRLSNIGQVILPSGTKAPIRGRICMDQLCVEVPDGETVAPGDTVTLIGSVGDSSISVSEIAELIETTPHEITTCLTARVLRVAG